jgi:hypothetical protein
MKRNLMKSHTWEINSLSLLIINIPKSLTITCIKLEIWIVLQLVLIYWQQFC